MTLLQIFDLKSAILALGIRKLLYYSIENYVAFKLFYQNTCKMLNLHWSNRLFYLFIINYQLNLDIQFPDVLQDSYRALEVT